MIHLFVYLLFFIQCKCLIMQNFTDEYYFDYTECKYYCNNTSIEHQHQFQQYEIIIKDETCIAINAGHPTDPFYRIKFKNDDSYKYKCKNVVVSGFPYVAFMKGMSQESENIFIYDAYIHEASFSQTNVKNIYLFSSKIPSPNAFCGEFDYKNKLCASNKKIDNLGLYQLNKKYSIEETLKYIDFNYLSYDNFNKMDLIDENNICSDVVLKEEETTLVISGTGFLSVPLLEKYKNKQQLTKIKIENGIVSIKSKTFEGFSANTIELPDTLIIIGSYAFENMINLKSITIPPGIHTFYLNWFKGCSSLESISMLYSGDKPSRLFADVDIPSLKTITYCGTFITTDDYYFNNKGIVFNVRNSFKDIYEYQGHSFESFVDYKTMDDTSLCPIFEMSNLGSGCEINILATVISSLFSFLVTGFFIVSLFFIPVCVSKVDLEWKKYVIRVIFMVEYIVLLILFFGMPILSFVLEMKQMDYLPDDAEDLMYKRLDFSLNIIVLVVTWFLLSIKIFCKLSAKQYTVLLLILALIFCLFVGGYIVGKVFIMIHNYEYLIDDFGVGSLACVVFGNEDYLFNVDMEKITDEINDYASHMHGFLQFFMVLGSVIVFLKEVISSCCGVKCADCCCCCPEKFVELMEEIEMEMEKDED